MTFDVHHPSPADVDPLGEGLAGRALPGPSKSLAGTVELIKDRDNLLTVFGIWIHVLSGLEQRDIFGAKFFLQFVYLLGQVLGFLAIFVPINLIELITEIEDLAIGLGFSPIATDDVDDLLCQFGSVRRLTLRIERQGADYQNREDQQPVHKTQAYAEQQS